MKNLLLSLTFIAIGLVSLNAQKTNYSFSETFEANGLNQLTAIVADGDISVQSHNKNTIEVQFVVTRKGKVIKGTKAEILSKIQKDVEILIKEGSNTLNVMIEEIPRSGLNSFNNSYHVDIKFFVPSETSCDITSSDGDLAISGLVPNQKCRTSDGDIAMKNIKGNVDLITSDGDIALKNIDGDVKAITSDGDIAAKNILGDFDAHTSDGDISRR